MEMDRRTFMQGAALSVGGLLIYSADVLAHASPAAESSARAAVEADAKHVFKVAGWDQRIQPTVPAAAGDEVLIHINQAWRTAWR